MVSILVAQQQEAKRAHRERLTAVRRLASELAVTNARHYVDAKKEQARRVLSDLQADWEQSHSTRVSQTEALLFEVDRRRGEGMRNATSFAERQRAVAQQEAVAWRAEESLEQHRFEVSLASKKLLAEREEVERKAKLARRDRVREAEERRTEQLLQRRLEEEKLSALRPPACPSPKAQQGPSSTVALHCRDDIAATAEREAQKHAAMRRTELEQKNRHVRQRQDEARQRAKKAVEQQRLEEERLRMKEEQEMSAKTKLLEDALRRADVRMMTVDYQEQESRRATNLNRRLHLEFEETFLRGPWRDAGLGRHDLHEGHINVNFADSPPPSGAPAEATSPAGTATHGATQDQESSAGHPSPIPAVLFVPFAQLPSYRLETTKWTEGAPGSPGLSGRAKPKPCASGDGAVSEEETVPRQNSPIPQPQYPPEPKAAVSPLASAEEAPEPEQESESDDDRPTPFSETAHLRQQHERYLEELNRLRERISQNVLLTASPTLPSLREQHQQKSGPASRPPPSHLRPPLPPRTDWQPTEPTSASVSSMSSPAEADLDAPNSKLFP